MNAHKSLASSCWVGVFVGAKEGGKLGDIDGLNVGRNERLGKAVGFGVGLAEGSAVGINDTLGVNVGRTVGVNVTVGAFWLSIGTITRDCSRIAASVTKIQ